MALTPQYSNRPGATAFCICSKMNGEKYYLHCKDAKLIGGGWGKLYYFAKEAEANAIDQIPRGYEIIESARSGLPLLKKVK